MNCWNDYFQLTTVSEENRKITGAGHSRRFGNAQGTEKAGWHEPDSLQVPSCCQMAAWCAGSV